MGEKCTALVCNTLAQANTDLDGFRVPIDRGVMQGDPLSPLLFNVILDWALSAAPEEVGVDLCWTHFRYLAFADDVVLLASSPVGLRMSVDTVASTATAPIPMGLPLRPGRRRKAHIGETDYGHPTMVKVCRAVRRPQSHHRG